ncbi:hypothetical protein BB934_37925 (plasmid) [Microvirga ossetica]|uniref:Uncharacterized protein n=1 Tax=Microvirga ossetica TaxID=1882682 RepID=A0A1B2EVT1_9HYPH|nr:hypothetical protein BB934_37925 [Microvirga ossetica]
MCIRSLHFIQCCPKWSKSSLLLNKPLNRCCSIGRSERLAVVELDTFTQSEDPRQRIGLLPCRGETAHRSAIVEFDEWIIDLAVCQKRVT